MTLMDDTNRTIILSLEEGALVEEPASVTVDTDFDSSFIPSQRIWLMFFADNEPGFRLTHGEAAQLRDRLNLVLAWYDDLSDEDKIKVNTM